jgi:hypothetical protein
MSINFIFQKPDSPEPVPLRRLTLLNESERRRRAEEELDHTLQQARQNPLRFLKTEAIFSEASGRSSVERHLRIQKWINEIAHPEDWQVNIWTETFAAFLSSYSASCLFCF